MVWAGDNYPQEHDATPRDCGHQGAKYHVHDGQDAESVSCVDCIVTELEMLRQGCPVQWRIERLSDDDDDPEYPNLSAQLRLAREHGE